uniref:Uncharacterized protein n=1 Tax=Salix viminalis TaxID=40686 RepID=A0A6N2MC83_SALVM
MVFKYKNKIYTSFRHRPPLTVCKPASIFDAGRRHSTDLQSSTIDILLYLTCFLFTVNLQGCCNLFTFIKGASKKQQNRGIDFKKIKRKIGRKLPPPKNTTNTEIKSKAIVLPEQSVVSEKAGLALSKKGLTLKELLQHTSHHNAKVRKGFIPQASRRN